MASSSTFKCELENIEQVMNYYAMECSRNNSPLFQVFVGVTTAPEQQVTIWEDETNPDGAEEHLRNLLEMLQSNVNNTNVYTIRCVKSFITAQKKGQEIKTGTGNGLRFQLNKSIIGTTNGQINGQPIINLHGNQNTPATVVNNSELIQVLKDRIKQLEQENELLKQNAIAALPPIPDEDEDEDDEEEEKQMSPKDMLFAALGGMLMNPAIQERLAGAAIGLLDNITQTKTPTQNDTNNIGIRKRFKPNTNRNATASTNETIEQG